MNNLILSVIESTALYRSKQTNSAFPFGEGARRADEVPGRSRTARRADEVFRRDSEIFQTTTIRSNSVISMTKKGDRP